MKQIYIVPTEFLSNPLLRGEWDAHEIPADPTKQLLFIEWSNHNDEAAFEVLPGVLMLGQPWEPTPAEAIPLLASFQNPEAVPKSAQAKIDGADSVATALKKTGRLGWRQIR